MPNKASYGENGAFKYFVGYKKDVGVIKLYIKVPQMNECLKYFDNNKKCMNFWFMIKNCRTNTSMGWY